MIRRKPIVKKYLIFNDKENDKMSNTSLIVNENMWNSVRVMWFMHDNATWSIGDCIFGVIAIIVMILIIIFMLYYFE